jgi:hypothetical protein
MRRMAFSMTAADSASLSLWSGLYDLGAWLVIIGVTLEGSEIAARWRHKLRSSDATCEPWFTPPEEKTPHWAHLTGDVGFALLVAGLLVEQFGHARITEITDRENKRLTSELKGTTAQAALANERATSNEVRVAELRKANLELEALIQPRRLNGAQLIEITKALIPFAGRSIGIESYATDSEGIVLGMQLESAFTAANIKSQQVTFTQMNGFELGVIVRGQDTNFVHVTAEAIRGSGLQVSENPPRATGPSIGTRAVGDVVVLVGLKPLAKPEIPTVKRSP